MRPVGAILAGLLLWAGAAQAAQPAQPQVRVAVVGGLQASPAWPRLQRVAGDALGLDIRTVAASPKEGVVPVFRNGQAELLLIHASDEAVALQAAGYAGPLRAWAFNEHVIVGPEADPLHIRQAHDGTEALQRIAAAKAPFLALRDPGSYSIVQRLWRRGNVRPDPAWAQWDGGESRHAVMAQVAERGAYAVIGRIPVATGKLAAPGVDILLSDDPLMRRPYVVLTAGPRHGAGAEARRNAERLADYLLSPQGQAALVDAASDGNDTWLYPLSAAEALLAPDPPQDRDVVRPRRPGSRARP